MKRKLSTSHDDAIVRSLRKDSAFAGEYLKTTLEDEDDPRVLLIALRHLVYAERIEKVPNEPERRSVKGSPPRKLRPCHHRARWHDGEPW